MGLIKREDAIRAVSEPFDRKYWQYTTRSIRDTVKALKDIPAVEPWDIYNPDEWCTDCKEYDTENHRCPRWNKVIRRTLEENPPVVNCVGCVHWVNDVANPDRMMCEKLKIPTEDFFFCGWGEREGAENEEI